MRMSAIDIDKHTTKKILTMSYLVVYCSTDTARTLGRPVRAKV